MTKSKKLIFFGNERLATATATTAPTLRALAEAGYQIEAVIASHVEGVSRQKRPLEIGPVAQAYNIPVILPGEKIELIEKVKKHPADAAVLVAFGKLIPQEVIELFPGGIINIHPSLLPKYRGPTPVETAILDGASETGVSLMRLAKEMDAGPVFEQKHVMLSGSETKEELAAKLLKVGSDMLIERLPAILEGWLTPKPQVESEATYTKLIKKEDGVLDFGQPAEVLERQVRAYAGWPRSSAEVFGHKIIVTKARVAENQTDGEFVIKCRPGFLEIKELIAPSGRTISGADFVRGYQK